MEYTDEQLKDPKWWDENAPEGSEALIDGSYWAKWDGEDEYNYENNTWECSVRPYSAQHYRDSPTITIVMRPEPKDCGVFGFGEDCHEALTFGPLKKDMKFDGGKPRMDLLPPDALLAVAEVLTFGAQKYEANSWKQVEGGKERYEAALLRHWAAFKLGETNDPESGLNHWAHIACNALFLVHLHSGDSNE